MKRWNWALAWAVLRGRIVQAVWSMEQGRDDTIVLTLVASDAPADAHFWRIK